MAASRAELRGVEADLAAAQSALAAINGQLAGTPRNIVTTLPADQQGGARAALSQALGQRAQLNGRGLTESHPDMVALNRQIAVLQQQASREGVSGPRSSSAPNPAYTSLVSIQAERQANAQALQARKVALQADLSSLFADQAQEPGVAAEANRISRDYEVLKDNYDKLLQDREDMRLRGQVQNERSAFKFDVIDPPTVPRTPIAPNRPLLLFGVLFAGIAAGIGAAFAVGQMRSTFATTAKLERALDLPVLGAVSATLTDAGRTLRAKRMKMFMAGSAALGGLFVILLAVEFVQRGMVA